MPQVFVDVGDWRWQGGDPNMPGTFHLSEDAHRTACGDVIYPKNPRSGFPPGVRPPSACRACEAEAERRGIL